MDFKASFKPVVPVKPELDFVTIKLNPKEAAMLQAVLDQITGGGEVRDFTSKLWREFYTLTRDLYPLKNIKGSIYVEYASW